MVGWHHQLNGHEFWVSSRSWWWTGKPDVLQSMGSQRVRQDWAAEINNRKGTQPHPSTENWIKNLLSMAPPIRKRTSFPHSQSLPLCFHKPLILITQRTDKMKNHNHRKWIKLITWTTALSNSIKVWAMPWGATQNRTVMVESSDKTWPTGEGNGKPL